MTDQSPPSHAATGAGGWLAHRPWDRLAAWVRGRLGAGWRPAWPWLAASAGLAIVLYYAVGALGIEVIDSDPQFGPGTVTARQSRTVAQAAALVRREVDVHAWTANDPFFLPGWVLDDMPNYQQGIVAAVARLMGGLADRQTAGGVIAPGGDLSQAAGLLKYPGTIWRFDPAISWAPTASAEKQYRRAARSLDAYQRALEAGTAGFDRRPAALAATLADIAADLGAASAVTESYVAEGHWALAGGADAVFYAAKGRLYAYSLLLRELGWDYAQAINDRGAGAAWQHMLATMRTAAALEPLVVIDGAPDASLLPSHLAAQGFYLLRARQQLGELAETLRR